MLVMVDCFEDLVIVNAFKQSLEFVKQLSRICFENDSNLVVRVDHNKFTKKQLELIEKTLALVGANSKTISSQKKSSKR